MQIEAGGVASFVVGSKGQAGCSSDEFGGSGGVGRRRVETCNVEGGIIFSCHPYFWGDQT